MLISIHKKRKLKGICATSTEASLCSEEEDEIMAAKKRKKYLSRDLLI